MSLPPTDPRYRPLLAAVPRVTSGGVEMDIGDRVVEVEGDPLEVARLLSLCDGSRTVEQLAAAGDVEPAELRQLVGQLTGESALIDCGEAWRLFQAASSPTSPLLRPASAEEVDAAAEARFSPSRRGPALPLAPTSTELDRPLSRRRSSTASDPSRPVTFEELSTLLAQMYGGEAPGRRAVPSGGGLYPLVLHVALADRLGPAAAGTWWHDAPAATLHAVRAGAEERRRIFVPAADTFAHLERGQPVVVISAEIARVAQKYGPRAYRLALLEGGAAMQNAYLAAASLGVPVRAMLGIDEAGAAEALELRDGTVPLLALFVGI